MKKLVITGLLAAFLIPLAVNAQDEAKLKKVENNGKAITEMIAQLDELSTINQGILAKSLTKAEYDSVMQILTSTQAKAPAGKTVNGELTWLHDEMVMLEELLKSKRGAQGYTAAETGNYSGSKSVSAENKILIKQLDTMKMAAREQKVALDTITRQLAVIKKIVENSDAKVISSKMTRIDDKGQTVNLEYGYYVVLESFKGKEGTPMVTRAWKKKGLDVIVVHNTERDWFFVYSEKYNDLNTALDAMEKTRKSGLVKDAWVHNYHPKEEEKGENKESEKK